MRQATPISYHHGWGELTPFISTGQNKKEVSQEKYFLLVPGNNPEGIPVLLKEGTHSLDIDLTKLRE